MKVGDRVQFNAAYVRSTGQYTGPIPFARGVIVALEPLSAETVLARVDWGDPEIPGRVNVANLEKETLIAREAEMDRYGAPYEYQTKKYQGWASYETWLVALWIEQGSYEMAIEFALQDPAPDESDWKAWVTELVVPEDEWPGGLHGDLLTSALSEVDWREIAADYEEIAKERRKFEDEEEVFSG